MGLADDGRLAFVTPGMMMKNQPQSSFGTHYSTVLDVNGSLMMVGTLNESADNTQTSPR